MGRRWSAVLGLVLAALLGLAACSSGGPDTGSVEGHLRMVGGPPPGQDIKVPGVVTARFSDGHRVTAHVKRNGHYIVKGHPGAVVLTGRSPRYGGGKSRCSARGRVTVKADATVTADVLCDMY